MAMGRLCGFGDRHVAEALLQQAMQLAASSIECMPATTYVWQSRAVLDMLVLK